MTRTSIQSYVIDFFWYPQDELMALKPPQRYGRVELDLPDGVKDGVIERIVDRLEPREPGGLEGYHLRISTAADFSKYTAEQTSDIGVKVCS